MTIGMPGCRVSDNVTRIWFISASLLSIPQRGHQYLQYHFLLSAIPVERAKAVLKSYKSTGFNSQWSRFYLMLNLARAMKCAEWLSPHHILTPPAFRSALSIYSREIIGGRQYPKEKWSTFRKEEGKVSK